MIILHNFVVRRLLKLKSACPRHSDLENHHQPLREEPARHEGKAPAKHRPSLSPGGSCRTAGGSCRIPVGAVRPPLCLRTPGGSLGTAGGAAALTRRCLPTASEPARRHSPFSAALPASGPTALARKGGGVKEAPPFCRRGRRALPWSRVVAAGGSGSCGGRRRSITGASGCRSGWRRRSTPSSRCAPRISTGPWYRPGGSQCVRRPPRLLLRGAAWLLLPQGGRRLGKNTIRSPTNETSVSGDTATASNTNRP